MEILLRLQKFYGQNVYGVLRAPRAGSTEAVVLSVPYRPPEAEGERTTGGMALMLALAKAFRSEWLILWESTLFSVAHYQNFFDGILF